MSELHLRISDKSLAFIDCAAAIRRVARAKLMLRSREVSAVETLNERLLIALCDKACDAFGAALDAPAYPPSTPTQSRSTRFSFPPSPTGNRLCCCCGYSR